MRIPLAAFVFGLSCALVLPAQESKDPGGNPGVTKQDPAPGALPNKAALREAAQAAVQSGDMAKASECFKKITEVDPKDAQAWHMYGYTLHAQGKIDEALPIHMKAAEFPAMKATALYNVACVHALKKDANQAVAWLEKAVGAGFSAIDTMEGDTDFDAIRSDPRFLKLQDKVRAQAANPAAAGAPQLFTVTTERKSFRYFLMSGAKEKRAQFAIDYGTPAWKPEYDQLVAEHAKDSPRWRFGQDFWTTLDTSAPMEIGSTKVPAGLWYLTLQRKGGKFLLQLHDPAAVRSRRIDAFNCGKLEGGIDIEMQHSDAQKPSAKLVIAAEADADDPSKGTLSIAYGPHILSVGFVVKTAESSAEPKR